jgi:glycosyltransferase involved in cell wall biosynthesis
VRVPRDSGIRARPSVLVVHPGRQHSHQLARALASSGMLAGYWAGVPLGKPERTIIPNWIWERYFKYDSFELPRSQVHAAPMTPIARRIAGKLLPLAWAVDVSHRIDAAFDAWSARLLERSDSAPDLVVCYENAALATFRMARSRGAKTVLDAASVHHRWQDRSSRYRESARAHARITARKDAELALADYVITCSELARASYVAGGVAPERVTAVPLGVDLDRFAPDTKEENVTDVTRCHFVFAGQPSRLKGLDTLLEASARLLADGSQFRLSIAGGAPRSSVGALPRGTIVLGHLTQAELATLFRQADCVVLPSRFDSFGMVVLEALACGTPVIVSDHVGAAGVVRPNESGWIVPAADSQVLANQMQWCIGNLESLRGMRSAARQTALAHSWSVYGQKVCELLQLIAAA